MQEIVQLLTKLLLRIFFQGVEELSDLLSRKFLARGKPMPVIVRTRKKYRGLARTRIAFTLEMCTRIVSYDTKHPTMKILDTDGQAAMVVVLEQLLAAYNAVVPR